VLFNRFYQPNLDPDRLLPRPDLKLSEPSEMRLPLYWIGMLAGRVNASLAASTGGETATEIAKYLLGGADVVMTTSSLLGHGTALWGALFHVLPGGGSAGEFHSVAQCKGTMSRQNLCPPATSDRADYIRMLQEYSKPIARRR